MKARSGPAGRMTRSTPNALAALPEVRQLIFAGKYADAANLISAKIMAGPLQPDAV